MCIHRGSKNEPPPSNGPTSTHIDRIERTRGSHLGLEPDFGSLGSMTPTKKQIFFGSVNLLHQACTWSSNIAQNILNIFMNLTPMVSGLVSRVMERGSGSMRSLFISIPRKKNCSELMTLDVGSTSLCDIGSIRPEWIRVHNLEPSTSTWKCDTQILGSVNPPSTMHM